MKKSIYQRIKEHLQIYLLCWGSYFVRKRKGSFSFYLAHNTKQLSGNVKALCLYLVREHPEVEITLVTPYSSVAEQALTLGIPVTRNWWKRYWAFLSAEFIVVDAYTKLFRLGIFSLIQLGHGAGFKNIGLLNDHLKAHPKKLEWTRRIYSHYRLVLATSKSIVQKKNESFGVDVAKITGFPRNDILFNPGDLPLTLKEKYGLKGYARIVTYAPTFRDFSTSQPFSRDFWQKLQEELQRRNWVFIIKKHPWDTFLQIPDQFENIRELTEVVSDQQELLLITDLLISDYSSIVVDFVLTGNPILTYAYDLEAYCEACRSIYYNLGDILPKPLVKDEKELLRRILVKDWIVKEEYKQSYSRFRSLFHQYIDGDSCERTWDEICKLSEK